MAARAGLAAFVVTLGCAAARLPAGAPGATAASVAPEQPGWTTETAIDRPTWTALYARYFGPSSPGDCGRSSACHADVVTDATSAYAWLLGRGYISGTQSPLVSATNSCLRWFGGNMPPGGSANEAAARELSDWVAGGAKND
jgi:hypothetical protein